MRAPFQILAIPYKITDGTPSYCVFHRADHDQWQFVAGGGEDDETPAEAARREAYEECGSRSDKWTELTSLAYIPAAVISAPRRAHWDKDVYVIPEYAFAFECESDVTLSDEHDEFLWFPFDEALKKLLWDSNRTALYELNARLTEK